MFAYAFISMLNGAAFAQDAPEPPAEPQRLGPVQKVQAPDAEPRAEAPGESPDDEPRQGAAAENAPLEDEITPALVEAVDTGLAALARLQTPDGAFEGQRYQRNVAIASLAGIAFMADGQLPGRGVHGDVVERAARFVLENQSETGLFAAQTSHGPMYGHGFATLFLAELYGMMQGGPGDNLSSDLHDALVRATRLIVRSQNDEGGWRYNPLPEDADVSVTICQVMALRSVRNAGIEVPSETIDRAVEYVRICQNPDGGFRYQSRPGGSLWPRSAAGVATLFYAGIYEDQAIDEGLEYLVDEALPGRANPGRSHYFYGHYYAVQAMYLAGGDWWARWWPAVRARLLNEQQADGSWNDPSVGTSYGTAMALIVLQMPKRYLPIFQK